MPYLTRYGEAVDRILATYPPGPALVGAMEKLIQTAMDRARVETRDQDFAAQVCEGLHTGEPAGLKCLSCYLAEQHFQQETIVQAEIDSAKGESEENGD